MKYLPIPGSPRNKNKRLCATLLAFLVTAANTAQHPAGTTLVVVTVVGAIPVVVSIVVGIAGDGGGLRVIVLELIG